MLCLVCDHAIWLCEKGQKNIIYINNLNGTYLVFEEAVC